MVAASMAVLERGAAFVEVGKRDIWSPQRAAQERPDLAYHLIAIDFWTPAAVGANMRRLAAMLHAGESPHDSHGESADQAPFEVVVTDWV